MKKISIVLLMIAVIFVSGCVDTPQDKQNQNEVNENHIAELPYEELSEDEITALASALADEYKAEATYQKVLDTFGAETKPFSNIINAEIKHSTKIKELYEKYALDIPENELYNSIPEFETVANACSAGVQAEIENIALYDELNTKIDNEDIKVIFVSLKRASQESHLPAFERCSK
jgi:hypothetical protein